VLVGGRGGEEIWHEIQNGQTGSNCWSGRGACMHAIGVHGVSHVLRWLCVGQGKEKRREEEESR